MRRHLAEALDVLWPVSCAGCAAPATVLCDGCLTDWGPRHEHLDGIPLTTLGDYRGGLRSAVLACKDQGSVAVARRLARRLAQQCPAADVIAVVPPGPAGLRRRGFHAVRWVARTLAAGGSVSLLRFAGGRPSAQKRLGRVARISADRRMRASARVKNRRVVIVDDVVTTGATMRAAVAAIEAAGGTVVRIAALARTPLAHRLGL